MPGNEAEGASVNTIAAPVGRAATTRRASRVGKLRWKRWVLFLLPIALVWGGAFWYAGGGQVMSTDGAYVEASKVGVSTDVSGIVKQVDVAENQHVEAGQVLYRLDDLPFRLALDRADAQLGLIRNDIDALKANYQDTQTQIKQA